VRRAAVTEKSWAMRGRLSTRSRRRRINMGFEGPQRMITRVD
jgi:hypothetical protein